MTKGWRVFHSLASVGAAIVLAGCSDPTPAVTDGAASDTATDVMTIDAPPATTAGLLKACVLSTSCLGTVNNIGPGGRSINQCMTTLQSRHTQPWDPLELGRPPLAHAYDAIETCAAANPTTCADFRQCLVTANAGVACSGSATCAGNVRFHCPPQATFGLAIDCAAAGLTCQANACVGAACAFTGERCSTSGTVAEACPAGTLTAESCAPGSHCVMTGATATCMPGAEASCGANGASCAGDDFAICLGGTSHTVSCAAFGTTCKPGGCAAIGTACDATAMTPTCSGDVLQTCVSGVVTPIDCAMLGGTCVSPGGPVSSCSLP